MTTTRTKTTEQTREIVDTIAAPAMRIPAFWLEKIAVWFRQLEPQFTIAKITDDETKYRYVICQLDAKHVEEVEDLSLFLQKMISIRR